LLIISKKDMGIAIGQKIVVSKSMTNDKNLSSGSEAG
jgi:hypothetical protein